VTTDGDKGLEAAIHAVYGHVRIQDCVFHKINRLHQNAENKKRGRKMMSEASVAFAKTDIRNQRKALRRFCDKWRSVEHRAVHVSNINWSVVLKSINYHLSCAPKPRQRILCEGLFKQIRARTNKVGAFESPMALELFVFAIVCQKTWINIPGRPPSGPLIRSESPHSS